MIHFKDRADGGPRLAALLKSYAGRSDVVVIGLARGGLLRRRKLHAFYSCRLMLLLYASLVWPAKRSWLWVR